MFFEYLFYAPMIEAVSAQLKQVPKETQAIIATAIVVPIMHKRHTNVQIARIKSQSAVEIARLEKETAELKYKTAKLFEVKEEREHSTSKS